MAEQRALNLLLGVAIGDCVGAPFEFRRELNEVYAAFTKDQQKEVIRKFAKQRFNNKTSSKFARAFTDDTATADLKISAIANWYVHDGSVDFLELYVTELLRWTNVHSGALFQGTGGFTRSFLCFDNSKNKFYGKDFAPSDRYLKWLREHWAGHHDGYFPSFGNGALMSIGPGAVVQALETDPGWKACLQCVVEGLSSTHQDSTAYFAYMWAVRLLQTAVHGKVCITDKLGLCTWMLKAYDEVKGTNLKVHLDLGHSIEAFIEYVTTFQTLLTKPDTRVEQCNTTYKYQTQPTSSQPSQESASTSTTTPSRPESMNFGGSEQSTLQHETEPQNASPSVATATQSASNSDPNSPDSQTATPMQPDSKFPNLIENNGTGLLLHQYQELIRLENLKQQNAKELNNQMAESNKKEGKVPSTSTTDTTTTTTATTESGFSTGQYSSEDPLNDSRAAVLEAHGIDEFGVLLHFFAHAPRNFHIDNKPVKFSQRGLNSLVMSLYCILRSHSIHETMWNILLLGGDTDTVGAIALQLGCSMDETHETQEMFDTYVALDHLRSDPACKKIGFVLRNALKLAQRYQERCKLFVHRDWYTLIATPTLLDCQELEDSPYLLNSKEKTLTITDINSIEGKYGPLSWMCGPLVFDDQQYQNVLDAYLAVTTRGGGCDVKTFILLLPHLMEQYPDSNNAFQTLDWETIRILPISTEMEPLCNYFEQALNKMKAQYLYETSIRFSWLFPQLSPDPSTHFLSNCYRLQAPTHIGAYSAEHHYSATLAEQVPGAAPHIPHILQCDDPCGYLYQMRIRPPKGTVTTDIMKTALRAKFDVTTDEGWKLVTDLNATAHQRLIAQGPSPFWATGSDGKGRNMLGVLLGALRAELRQQYEFLN